MKESTSQQASALKGAFFRYRIADTWASVRSNKADADASTCRGGLRLRFAMALGPVWV